MKFVEITPKTKHQKKFEEFITELIFNNAFSENGVIAKRNKESIGSIRLEFNIGSAYALRVDLIDSLKHFISVDIRIYEEQKFFSKTYYGAFIRFVTDSESKPKKFINCMIPEVQESLTQDERNVLIAALQKVKARMEEIAQEQGLTK